VTAKGRIVGFEKGLVSVLKCSVKRGDILQVAVLSV
jgi:hypothetical protein